MQKKVKKLKDEDLKRTHIYMPVGDWKAAKLIGKKKRLKGADMVRKWVREGIEREEGK